MQKSKKKQKHDDAVKLGSAYYLVGVNDEYIQSSGSEKECCFDPV